MTVTFYSFAKRSNSTKQPTGGTSLSCQLKDQCNMINPTIVIQNVPSGWSPVWNYAHIPVFHRYYFINNWRWLNGVWEADLISDVLASFRTEIGNLSEYVVRASADFNEQIVDMQYPTTAETRVSATRITNNVPYQRLYGQGYYVLGVISNDPASSIGGITYYQMSASQLAALKEYMMSDTFLADQALNVQTITDILPNELLKTLYDPFKYIASCVWMPFPMGDISLKTSAAIPFGWWTPTDAGTNITGYRLNSNGYIETYTQDISVSSHPQSATRGVFLDHAPFSDRMLYYPPFGSIPLNDDSIIGGDVIRINLDVDMYMGDAVLNVNHWRPSGGDSGTDMGLIARVAAPLAVPIQLAQTTIDINGSVTAVETMAAQGTAAAFIGSASKSDGSLGGFLSTLWETGKGAVQSAGAAVGDVINNPVGQLHTSGTNGSLAQFAQWPWFIQKWRIVADDDNPQKGRPLCEVKTLNTIPGYIMVDSPDVEIACMDAERQQIIAFLSSGFYYE